MIRLFQYGFLGLLFVGFMGFGSVLAFFGGVSLVEEFNVWLELRPARTWPVQHVEIIDAKRVTDESHWYPVPARVECRFRVQDGGRSIDVTQRKFSGHYSFMSTSQAAFGKRLSSDGLEIYPGGARKVMRPAHVNPDDPAQAILASAFDDAALGFSMMTAVFIFGLGLSMILVVVLIIFRVLLSPDRKLRAEDEGRLTPNSFTNMIWLWCAVLMTPGTIAAGCWLAPALIRRTATSDYWIPLGLQVGLMLLFWWLFIRGRRWIRLAGLSYIQLDPVAISRLAPPRGRLHLAPTRDFPDQLTINFRLDRRISSKQFTTDFKRSLDVRRVDDASASGPWYPVQLELEAGAVRPNAPGTSYWHVLIRGRAEGRRFKIDFFTQGG